jgi:hypothetical protein
MRGNSEGEPLLVEMTPSMSGSRGEQRRKDIVFWVQELFGSVFNQADKWGYKENLRDGVSHHRRPPCLVDED